MKVGVGGHSCLPRTCAALTRKRGKGDDEKSGPSGGRSMRLVLYRASPYITASAKR